MSLVCLNCSSEIFMKLINSFIDSFENESHTFPLKDLSNSSLLYFIRNALYRFLNIFLKVNDGFLLEFRYPS